MELVKAVKDGNGNIVITQDSFEMLLACLDNQKFVHEAPQNGDSLAVGQESYRITQKEIQDTIDAYNRACRKILHQSYVVYVRPDSDGYWLAKRYEHQDKVTPWSGDDLRKVYELFKDTRRTVQPFITNLIKNLTIPEGMEDAYKAKAEEASRQPETWLFERPLQCDGEYLTVSEDGRKNRPWKEEEIVKIQNALNNNYPETDKADA